MKKIMYCAWSPVFKEYALPTLREQRKDCIRRAIDIGTVNGDYAELKKRGYRIDKIEIEVRKV